MTRAERIRQMDDAKLAGLLSWLKDLECPNCGPGYVIKTGQDLEDEDEQTN